MVCLIHPSGSPFAEVARWDDLIQKITDDAITEAILADALAAPDSDDSDAAGPSGASGASDSGGGSGGGSRGEDVIWREKYLLRRGAATSTSFWTISHAFSPALHCSVV